MIGRDSRKSAPSWRRSSCHRTCPVIEVVRSSRSSCHRGPPLLEKVAIPMIRPASPAPGHRVSGFGSLRAFRLPETSRSGLLVQGRLFLAIALAGDALHVPSFACLMEVGLAKHVPAGMAFPQRSLTDLIAVVAAPPPVPTGFRSAALPSPLPLVGSNHRVCHVFFSMVSLVVPPL